MNQQKQPDYPQQRELGEIFQKHRQKVTEIVKKASDSVEKKLGLSTDEVAKLVAARYRSMVISPSYIVSEIDGGVKAETKYSYELGFVTEPHSLLNERFLDRIGIMTYLLPKEGKEEYVRLTVVIGMMGVEKDDGSKEYGWKTAFMERAGKLHSPADMPPIKLDQFEIALEMSLPAFEHTINSLFLET